MAYDGSIKIDTKLDTSGLQKGVSSLTGTLKKIGATLAIGKIAKEAFQAGLTFESAFAGVKKTVDATDAQLSQLRDGIRDMAKELPTSANEISGVAEAAGQLGIQTDNILAFSKTMTMLGDATNMTAETAATTLARFANITGMTQDNFDRLGSTIVALGNNFATTEAEIADMGMNIASAGTQVGMTEAQIMGFATALSSVGMEAQAGGTAISKLMIDMQLATETGGESLQQFANVAGVSAEEFATAFKTDAAGAITKFITGLNDTDRHGKTAIAVLDEMGISEVRLRDAILRAANSGDLFTKAIKTGTDAWEDNTALTKEAEQRYETLESKLGMLKNNLIDLGISIYDGISEPLKDAVSGAIEQLGELSASIEGGSLKGAVSGLGEAFASLVNVISQITSVVLPPLITILGVLGTTLDELIPIILSSVAAFKAVTTVQNLTSVFAKLIPWLAANPWAVAAAGVAALGVGIYKLTKPTDENEKRVKKLTKSTNEYIQTLEDSKSARQEALDSQLSEIENTKWLANELAVLVDENGKVAESDRSRAQLIISELNAALGTEITMTDGIVEGYENVQESIKNTILQKQALAILESQEATAAEARKGLSDTLLKIAEREAEIAVLEAEKSAEIRAKVAEGWDEQALLESGMFEKKDKQIAQLKENVIALNNTAQQQSDTMQEYVETSTAITEGNTEKMQKIVADHDVLNSELLTSTEKSNLQLLQGHASTYTSLIKQASDGQIEWSDTVLTAAASMAQTLFDESQEAGANLPAGLIKGIAELEGMSEEEISAYCKLLLETFTSGLEEHSPSKATERNGQWLIEGLLNGIKGTIENVFSSISDFCKTIIENFLSFLNINTLIENGKNLLSGIISGIDSMMEPVCTEVTTFATNAITKFSEYLSLKTLYNVGTDVIQGLIDGIKGMAEKALTAISEVVSPLAPFAKLLLNINSPSKLFRDEIGKSIPEGMALGISKNAVWVVEASKSMAEGSVTAAKKVIDAHSPSKRFERQVGKTIPQGVALGIKKNSYEVTDAVKQMFDDLDLQKEIGALSEAEYYEKLAEYRDEYLEQGTKEWWDYTKKILDYDEKMVDQQFKNLDWLHDNNIISEAQYYQKLAELRDEYFSESDEEWQDYTEKIADYYMDTVNEIKDKFSDLGSVVQEKTYLKVNGEEGGTYLQPNDYAYATEQLTTWANEMKKLKAKAGDDATALSIYEEVLALDVETGIEMAKMYNAMSGPLREHEWEQTLEGKRAYDKALDEQSKMLADINGQTSTLNLDLETISEETKAAGETAGEALIQGINTELEEFAPDWDAWFEGVPQEAFNMGAQMIASLRDGALSEIESFKTAISEKLISAFSGISIGLSGGNGTAAYSVGGDTYNFYSSNSTVTEQLKAAENQSVKNRLRGWWSNS